VDHSEVRAAWDDVAAAYADARDPDGPDAALIDDLLAELPTDRPRCRLWGRRADAREPPE